MRRILISTLASLTCLIVYAQNWQKLVINGEKDFNKIQEAFYEEWDGKEIERGSSYKQFKRWEYRMLPRLIEERYLPNVANGYFIKETEKSRTDSKRSSVSPWTSMGPDSWTNGPNGYNPGLGRVNTVDGHPTEPNTLFVGTPGGGLWKSTNSGETWVPVFEDLTVLGVSDFYIDPQNTNKYYLLTGDAYGGHTNSVGVFVSNDAGASWAPMSFNPEVSSWYRNYRMVVNPNNSEVIFVAGNGGLMRSNDGGSNWSIVLDEHTTDVEFKPGSTSVLYASTSSGAFYRSTNSGLNWTQILPPNSGLGRTAIGVSEANPDYVYMLASASNSTFGGVYKSVNSGASMALQSNSPNIFGYSQTAGDDRGQGWYDLAIAVNPSNAEDIYVSGIHIWNSKDGGQSWFDETSNPQRLNFWVYNESNTDNYVHADNHTLDFINGDLYAGCDGGVFKTSNLGHSWVDLSSSLNISQFYRLGQDVNDPERVTAGAQDNGSNVRSSDGSWVHLFGADGMEALIDYEDGNRIYASYQLGGIIRFYNNFYQENISAVLTDPEGAYRENGGWITPFVLDPNDSETIYLGLNNIWKSENRGSTWTQISDFGSGSTQLHMSISAIDNNYMYVTSGWNAYRTSNGGASWQAISNGLPTEYNTYITVSEDDPLTIYTTFSGYSNGQKVYRSTNGGSTWENISDGLPNIPVNTIVHQKGSNIIYVGTDVGVYMKDGESRWTTWFDGLPNVEVAELEIHYGAEKIRAATFGRGIWERDIPESLRINSVTASATEILESESVNFSISYDGSPSGFSWTFPGGTPETSSEESPVVTYNDAGEFNVILQLQGGNEPMVFLEDYIKVEALIKVNDLNVDTTTPRLFESVVFAVMHDGEADSQLWTFEGGSPETSTESNPSISYNQVGTFDVSVTVNGRNTDSRTFENFITVLQPLGVDNGQIQVSPTVATQSVEIDVAESNTQIQVIDMGGKIAFSKLVDSGITELDFSSLQNGLYTIRLIDSKGTRTTKVVKK